MQHITTYIYTINCNEVISEIKYEIGDRSGGLQITPAGLIRNDRSVVFFDFLHTYLHYLITDEI